MFIKELSEKYQIKESSLENIYNLNQKIKFVENQYGNQEIISRGNIIKVFNSIGKFENKYSKDVNSFNTIEIQGMFTGMHITHISTFSNRKNILRKYFEWSVTEKLIKLTDLNIFDSINTNIIQLEDSLPQKYFKDFRDLNNCIETIINCHKQRHLSKYDKSKNKTTDALKIEEVVPFDLHRFDTIKVILFLGWFGLELDEICSLKKSSVKDNAIFFGNKKIQLSNDIIDFIKTYISSEGYTSSHRSFTSSRFFEYKDTDYLVKVLTDNPSDCETNSSVLIKLNTFKTVVKQLDEDNRYYNHTFNFSGIKNSGLFHRMYEYEQNNGMRFNNGTEKELLSLLYVSSISNSQKHSLLNNFQNWKNVFYGI